ncbi:MAG: putative Ig domain-containing protein [Candidatus Acidiferrales bacterium]|jgi:hypothetical protein
MRLRKSLTAVLLACGGLLLLSGCHSSAAGITVQILPGGTTSIDEGQSYKFTATVANDIHNQGVTWSLTQTTVCSGSGCGTLTNVTNSSVTYVAPSNLTATESVTLTATSISAATATATSSISVVIPVTFTTTLLPNAANGVPYNQAIAVTGGVSPLTFSIQSGTSLPAGLTLNSSGIIVGKPTAPTLNQPTIQSSFTVVVTDNGTPPLAVTEPYTISVTPPPPLAITTTSVPAGVANTKYTGAVSTTGGVAPLTWTLLPGNGTLPPGLGLGTSSGQITGVIPKGTSGIYNFIAQVQDSSLPSGQVLQQQLSITVTQPPALAISTTVLPPGTTATGYNVPLLTSGGIGPFTWTVTSGQLPSGLTLASDGTISGLPVLATTATPDEFTVQVQDSEAIPATASQSLSISIAAGSTSSDALITGSYSFLFNGFDSNGSVAIAGSIATDGNGHITSGEEDSNRAGTNNLITAIPLLGSYSLGSDGRGTMELIAINPSTQVTLTTDYRIVLDSTGTIHFIQNNDITTAGVGTDTLGTHGEGIMKPVVGSFSAVSFNGNYSFLFAGQDTGAKPAALAGAIRANGNGDITSAAGGVSSDFNDNGTVSSQNLSGSFSVGTMNDRGTAEILFQISGKSASTLQFAFYFVSPSDIYFVETDSTTTALSPVFYRLSGEMIAQDSSYAFANTSLSGISVATASASNGSNASVLAGLLTSAGSGSATLTYDENNGGAITSPSPSFSGTYSVAGNGRVPFTNLGSRAAVAYLTGPGQGFLLGSDAAVTTGLLEQQSSGSFADSSVQDGYTLTTSLPVETGVANLLGQVNSDGAGSVTGIVDEVDPPTMSTTEGKANLDQSLIAHINFIGSNGRGTATTNSPTGIPATVVFYVLSPAHFRAISADSNPGNAHPDVLFFDH